MNQIITGSAGRSACSGCHVRKPQGVVVLKLKSINVTEIQSSLSKIKSFEIKRRGNEFSLYNAAPRLHMSMNLA